MCIRDRVVTDWQVVVVRWVQLKLTRVRLDELLDGSEGCFVEVGVDLMENGARRMWWDGKAEESERQAWIGLECLCSCDKLAWSSEMHIFAGLGVEYLRLYLT